MKTQPHKAQEQPAARRAAVTHGAARADAARRFAEQARRAAEDTLAAMHDTHEASELAVLARAVAACRAVRDAEVGSAAWHRAVLEACAVADAADADGVVLAHG